ncbi:MAG: IS200/IS605 family accessory protein TnpB-related protein, partial [Clostridia bacterium]|nr:IS200/IS605 family accessory protein TnpB-related protein [Clostridia bacterium]
IACANNVGIKPFIIDGRELKALNQWYNKRRARLMSDLTSGYDPKHSRKQSKQLESLNRSRSDKIRDLFYKVSHYICRQAVLYRIDAIIVGHNEGQKNGVGMGKKNNQTFVSIPYAEFIGILKWVAGKYGIPVIVREESYTSQADLSCLDPIPTFDPAYKGKYQFSGRRLHRGLYRWKDGTILNADINGAANILRKEYPHAFDGMNVKYLTSVTMVRWEDLKPNKKKPPEKASKDENAKNASDKGKKNRKSDGAKVAHRERKTKYRQYKVIFKAKKKGRKKHGPETETKASGTAETAA